MKTLNHVQSILNRYDMSAVTTNRGDDLHLDEVALEEQLFAPTKLETDDEPSQVSYFVGFAPNYDEGKIFRVSARRTTIKQT
jgi:hypothetical protein